MAFVLKNRKRNEYVSEVIFNSRSSVTILYSKLRINARVFTDKTDANHFLDNFCKDLDLGIEELRVVPRRYN